MIASLTMYDSPALRSHLEQLWKLIAVRLGDASIDLDWDLDHLAAARAPDVVVAQTCGWPLVTELAGRVDVIGTFDVTVDGARDGTYRSTLIEGHDGDAPAAVNGYDSLSGWVSLVAAIGEPATVTVTGTHVASVIAVAEGRASRASIDTVTLDLLGEQRPELLAAVRVVGHGPRVPCLPLVTRQRTAIEPLRAAIASAVESAPAGLLARLRIRSFVPLDWDDYAPLRELQP